ncbi:MAG: NmrA family NAD(P)-binding protein [Pirellulaceae bacterium]|jgi:NADH dehydrogenase|nr:NmrA family NAD(P)-binding protein [Pirellulaceae bacterium]
MQKAVITGAFSYTGSAVTQELLRRGWQVHTLTNRATPPGCESISAAPLRFEREHIVEQLTGANLFINTYWIRIPWQGQTFDTAVDNSKLLLSAAKDAGVERVVHVSVSNAAEGTNLGYYAGKDRVESFVRSELPNYAIVCPTLVVGPNDVLSNNIAWFLRHFPFFPMPDRGDYRLQPITLDDTARVIVDAGESKENQQIDAAGPDIMSFREYLGILQKACGVRRWMPGVPGWLSLLTLKPIELLLRDIVLTKEELLGLKQELLVSKKAPLGTESVEKWLMENAGTLGYTYVNDLRRHFGRDSSKAVLTDSAST